MYEIERNTFEQLKQRCTDEARCAYESAIEKLHERYNTTIHENRFIVGGAVEVFTYALLRSVGIHCSLYLSQATRGDILLQGDHRLLIKSTFTGGAARVKLINKMGDGPREWRKAALFVVSDVGIVYGAPHMVDDFVVDGKDSIDLTKRGLKHLIEDKSNVLQMNIVRKSPPEKSYLSQKASTELARQIIIEQKLDVLLQVFPDQN